MKNTKRDRASLKHIVETYGKEDVMKYVNHLDEYLLGGNDWGDDYKRNNPAFIRRIDNSDEIPVNVMEYLWYIGRYGHEFTEILYNGLDIKQSKLRNVRDMSLADVQYWNKVIDPIIGLMSNKTNIKNDEHQITAKDLAQYRNIYMKLESCPCQALQNASRVLMNFVKSIPASSNVNSDRAALESIVSTYGKEDVMKYVNHLDEAYQIGSNLPDFNGVSDPIIKEYIAKEHILKQTGIYLSRISSYIDNRLSKRKELFGYATYARDMIKDTWTNYCHSSDFFGSFVTSFAELAECFKEYDNNSVEQYYKKALEILGNIREHYEQGLLLLRSFNDDMKKRGMKESVNDDRIKLKKLVEAYGKEDVMKFVKHINEAIDESQAKKAAITKAYNEIDFEQDSPDDLMRILEELYDAAADEGYQLGYDEGYNQGYNDCDRGDEYE